MNSLANVHPQGFSMRHQYITCMYINSTSQQNRVHQVTGGLISHTWVCVQWNTSRLLTFYSYKLKTTIFICKIILSTLSGGFRNHVANSYDHACVCLQICAHKYNNNHCFTCDLWTIRMHKSVFQITWAALTIYGQSLHVLMWALECTITVLHHCHVCIKVLKSS